MDLHTLVNHVKWNPDNPFGPFPWHLPRLNIFSSNTGYLLQVTEDCEGTFVGAWRNRDSGYYLIDLTPDGVSNANNRNSDIADGEYEWSIYSTTQEYTGPGR